MKPILAFAIAFAALATPLMAQQDAKLQSNPVSTAVRQHLENRSKNMVAAAEQMPADKYSYSPTPGQITFGHLIQHIASSNGNLCAAIAGSIAPKSDIKESDAKEKLVQALKESFDFCATSLAKVDDSKLGEEITIFNRKVTRARAMIALPADWADHYAGEAMYLRLNGMLPPSAQPKKPAGEK